MVLEYNIKYIIQSPITIIYSYNTVYDPRGKPMQGNPFKMNLVNRIYIGTYYTIAKSHGPKCTHHLVRKIIGSYLIESKKIT